MKTLSIILPTLRQENAINCLNAIKANSYSNYEIIVVSRRNLLYYLNCQNYSTINVLDNTCCGTTYAIGLGLKHATGKYIVTLSDDCRVSPHWDDHMINFLDSFEPTDEILLGNFRVYDSSGEMPAIGYYGRQFSMFPIIRRENIDALGCYFSQDFNAYYSDPDLGMRIHEVGKIVTCKTAFIYHPYNPDELHLDNKRRYFKKDEEAFIKKWGHLGEFKGCEIIKDTK